jgi:modulator of FtsH protease
MQYNQTRVINGTGSLLSTHTVLRNTYLLLSLTLLFSALMAVFAVNSGIGTGTSMVAALVAFGLLFAIAGLKNSAWGILAVFAFTGCMGFSMGPMLNYFIKGYSNGGQLIATAFGGTGLAFLVSSAYVIITKKDLSNMGKLLMVGLVMCVIAGFANIFLKMPAMQLAISTVMVFVSTALIMFDTSRIINNGENNYISATVSLYLDILMLFQNLLYLLAAFSGNSRN